MVINQPYYTKYSDHSTLGNFRNLRNPTRLMHQANWLLVINNRKWIITTVRKAITIKWCNWLQAYSQIWSMVHKVYNVLQHPLNQFGYSYLHMHLETVMSIEVVCTFWVSGSICRSVFRGLRCLTLSCSQSVSLSVSTFNGCV